MKRAAPWRLIGTNGLRAGGSFPGLVLGLALGVMAGAAAAQSNGPAEAPPADFTGAQFIDSAGCAFARAAINGQTRWVPRLGPDRQPVCGLAPSLADAADTPASAAPGRADDTDTADAPAPDAATPARTAAATPAPAPAPAAAAAAPRPQAPRRTATPAAPAAAAPTLPDSIPAGDMTGIPTVPCPAHYPSAG